LQFFSLSLQGSDRQQDADLLEEALTDLERAYEASNDGLLFTVGYGPGYFERFDKPRGTSADGAGGFADPLGGVDLPSPGPLHGDEHVGSDDADVFVHLASDHASAVVATRQALFGDHRANGVKVATLQGVFEQETRRTGFVGAELLAEGDGNLLGVPSGAVSSESPTFMDFRSGFRGNQASEERVTVQSGRFAGGTVQHVETIRLLLGEWYERSTEEQVARLFSPGLDPETVGDHGDSLTDHNQVNPVPAEALAEMAERHGVVGHAQKMARFRGADGRPPILRWDANSGRGDRNRTWRTTGPPVAGTVACDTAISSRCHRRRGQYRRTPRRGGQKIEVGEH